MKIVIDIDENVFTRLFDNGVDTSPEDREVIDRAVHSGTPLPVDEIIEELESRKDYGTEYGQAMEDVIVILKAQFGIGDGE